MRVQATLVFCARESSISEIGEDDTPAVHDVRSMVLKSKASQRDRECTLPSFRLDQHVVWFEIAENDPTPIVQI